VMVVVMFRGVARWGGRCWGLRAVILVPAGVGLWFGGPVRLARLRFGSRWCSMRAQGWGWGIFGWLVTVRRPIPMAGCWWAMDSVTTLLAVLGSLCVRAAGPACSAMVVTASTVVLVGRLV
jgi:hypothetical protein